MVGPKTATVVVPEDQLSLAIGRDGQNARLAAKLTGWRIDIKSLPEAASELLFKLQNNPEYKIFNRQEEEIIPQVETTMAKKAEGRPITPEEYHIMGSFVDRVEQGVLQRRLAIRQEYEMRLKSAEEAVPKAVYELPVFTLGLPDEINQKLADEEYENIGDLMVQFFFDSNKLKAIEGIDEDVLNDIKNAFDLLTSTLPEPEPEVEPEAGEIEEKAVSPEEPAIEEVSEVEIEEEKEAEVEEIPDEVVETEALEAEVEEEISEEIIEEKTEEPISAEKPVEEETEDELESLEEIFKLKPEMLDVPDLDEEMEDDTKRRKRKKYVDVEYDPEKDVTIYRKKHKRKEDEWEDWDKDWDF
jgi:N utilization substance protein A